MLKRLQAGHLVGAVDKGAFFLQFGRLRIDIVDDPDLFAESLIRLILFLGMEIIPDLPWLDFRGQEYVVDDSC
jgi:hypothetical protein